MSTVATPHLGLPTRPPPAAWLALMPGWLLGVGLTLQWPALDARVLAAIGVAVGCAWLAARRWHRRARPRDAVLALALSGCVAALGSSAWRGQALLDARLPHPLEGVPLLLEGHVDSLVQHEVGHDRFRFAVTAVQRLDGRPVDWHPQTVQLGWWHDPWRESLGTSARKTLRAGQRWRLAAVLRRPQSLANPHAPDGELGWFGQGVAALGQVKAAGVAVLPQRLAGDGPGTALLQRREAWRDAIATRIGQGPTAGVLAALTVGDQAAIHPDDWDLLRRSGIAHLVSISGTHVTMFAAGASLLLRGAWRLWPQLGWRWPAAQAARFGGVLLAAGYTAVAGGGVPAQRTLLMLGVAALMRARGREAPWPVVMLAAACAVTTVDPWALGAPGFWLSFAAVGLLLASGAGTTTPVPAAGVAPALRRALGGHLRAQGVAAVGLAPLALLFFHQMSLVGIAVNLVAIPVVTAILTPLALAGIAWPPCWDAAGWMVDAGRASLLPLVEPGLAVWTSGAAPGWAIACGLAGGLMLVLPAPWRLRWLGLPLLLAALLPAPARPPEGRFELLAADIGQGNAVLIATRRHTLLVDTGPAWGPDQDAGERVLLPLMDALGWRRLDIVIVSHDDLDHTGGALSVLKARPHAMLLSSMAQNHPLVRRAARAQACQAGEGWRWDGVRFDFLHPDAAGLLVRDNDRSCVLKVTDAQGASALLPGDAEALAEAQMLARLPPAALRADVVLVPHHGSRTSSTAPWLQALRHRVAVVQAGHRNRFRHPAPDVVARHEAAGALLQRSDRCGAWRWRSGDDPREAACERTLRARFWHNRPASAEPLN